MKNILMAVLVLGSTAARAEMSPEVVENLQDHVKRCAVQTYTINQYGEKDYRSLRSLCTDVQVVKATEARIQVGGSLFIAKIEESQNSDGDFYDVTIRESRTGETRSLEAVRAYGDVLLGVLGGYTAGLPEERI